MSERFDVMSLLRKIAGVNQLLLIAFLGLALLVAHQRWAYHGWDRYFLNTSYCAPYAYPAYCIRADFLTDGTLILGEYSPLRPGMAALPQSGGRPGQWQDGPAGQYGQLARVPTQLQVDYVSLAEGRSYRGLFELPRAVLDSVFAFVGRHPARRADLPGRNAYQPGLEFVAGLAPGGVVVVWLKGNDYQVEIARFLARAYPTTWPKPLAVGNARDLRDLCRLVDSTERAQLAGPALTPFGHWDTLRTRYRYRIALGPPLRPRELHVYYVDAQQETVLAPFGPGTGGLRAVPQYLIGNPVGAEYWKKFFTTRFDDKETQRAFAEMQRTSAPGETFQLQVLPEAGAVRIFLKNRRQTIELTQAYTDLSGH